MAHLYSPDFNAHNIFHPTVEVEVEVEIAQERIRQARYSFNLALAMTAVCAIPCLTGAGLLVAGKVPEGMIATTGGMSPVILCVKFAREANDRLDKIFKEIKDDD